MTAEAVEGEAEAEQEAGESEQVSVCCWCCVDGDEAVGSVVETASGDAVELVIIAIGDGRRVRSEEPGTSGAARPLAQALASVTECESGGYCLQVQLPPALPAPVAHIIETELDREGEPGAPPFCRVVECGW